MFHRDLKNTEKIMITSIYKVKTKRLGLHEVPTILYVYIFLYIYI